MVSKKNLVFFAAIVILVVAFSGSSAAWTARSESLQARTPITDPAISREVAPLDVPTPTPLSLASEQITIPTVEGLPDPSGFARVEDTQHFSFYAESDSFALRNANNLAGQAELLVKEMGDRVDGDLGRRVSFYLYGASQRDFGGLSFFSPPVIYLEFGAKSNQLRTKALVAHELTHLITDHSLGYPDSLVHLEGIAHWASEDYWTSAVGESFDKRVRRAMAKSTIVPLADISTNRSLWRGATQLLAYDESGSFVGYLIQNYGLGQFKRVYLHSNYTEVYGKSLQDLESDWLAYLSGRVDALRQFAQQRVPLRAGGVGVKFPR